MVCLDILLFHGSCCVVGLSLLSKFVMSSTCLNFAEGKGSLHSFLKARGLATSLSAGVGDEGMHRSSLAYIFGMSIHLTDYGLEKVLSLSCLVYLEDFYFSALRCYSPHFLEDLEELLLMWSMSTCLDHNILVIQALQELFEFIARVFFMKKTMPFQLLSLITMIFICRFLTSLALFINTLSCYEKFRLNNGYLRNYRILETWNLDLQKSNLRMIMLQNLQVCLC